MGKTRLVTELAGQAADSGFTVLGGTASSSARRACRSPRSSTRCARWPAPRRRRSWPTCSARPDEAAALARRTRLRLDEPDADAVRPAAEDPLTRFGLTEREREILVLLAAGRSNPQIAGALFISPKTASVHVSNILAKLGVDSRVEAAAVAHRLGVTG